ncbi:MAG: UTP--glucose-1-phosphate uridylyltransferase [Mycoplasmataceae bacterium]|nr:UTP--glucose-1-phosphate uridylyltransferase [Mycoplasmataceae bacterium]
MRKVTKAIIPVAGLGTRFLPYSKTVPKEMLPILNIPSIQYIIEEAVASGIEEIIFITSSKKTAIVDYLDRDFALEAELNDKGKFKQAESIKNIAKIAKYAFVRQHHPRGLGNAILQAKNWIGDEPFAILLGDDVIHNEGSPALKQLIDVFNQKQCSVIGVLEVENKDVFKYGVIEEGEIIDEKSSYLKGVVEKPSIESAPSNKVIIGRYILDPKIFKYLERNYIDPKTKEVQLTDSILNLIDDDFPVIATLFTGKRYDLGSVLGFIEAQIDYSLRDDELKMDVLKMLKKQ